MIETLAKYLRVDERDIEPHMQWLQTLFKMQDLLVDVPWKDAGAVESIDSQVARGVAWVVDLLLHALSQCYASDDSKHVAATLDAVSSSHVPGAALVQGQLAFFSQPTKRPPVSIPAFLDAAATHEWAIEMPMNTAPPVGSAAIVTGHVAAAQSRPTGQILESLRDRAAAEGEVMVNPQHPILCPDGTAHHGEPSFGRSLPGDMFGDQDARSMQRTHLDQLAAGYGASSRTGIATPLIKNRKISLEEHIRSTQSLNPYSPPPHHKFEPNIERLPTPAEVRQAAREEVEAAERHGHAAMSRKGSRTASRRASLHLHSPSRPHSQCQQCLGMQDAMSPTKVVNNPTVVKLSKSGSRPGVPATPPLARKNWPLKEDKLWSTDLLSEYVKKSHSQIEKNPVSAAFLPDVQRHTIPAGAPPRKSLLDVAAADAPGSRLPEHINRMNIIEKRIHDVQVGAGAHCIEHALTLIMQGE